ncbi:MAG: hypothetical protein KC657_09080 [Myxococcales bacterium]|nr:hypothetical protein [Myxococcales bacterium]
MSRRILILSAAIVSIASSAHLLSERAASAAIPPQPEVLRLELESVTEDGAAVDAKADTAQVVRTRDGLSFYSADRTEEFLRAK